MARKNPTSQTRKSLFRVKLGHVLLGLVAIASLTTLMVYSVSALQAHQVDSRNVLSQESDASAMTFVQRESLNVIISLKDWSIGEASTRDVQISRALLGQRLQVVTQSGVVTYQLTPESYRTALKAMDGVVAGLRAIDPAGRLQYEKVSEPIMNTFAEEARYLSQVFEKITHQQTLKTVEQRVQAELIQAILLAIVLVFGGALGAWVAFDIVRGFKAVQAKIQQQRERLDASKNQLLLLQKVNEKSREFVEEIHAGLPTADLVKKLTNFIDSLDNDLRLDVEIVGLELKQFELIRLPRCELSEQDFQFMTLRLNEVMQSAINRDLLEHDLFHERSYDSLTELPNRTYFTAQVDERVAKVTNGQTVAMMLIDVDRFRDFNGSLGYQAGDTLLCEVAKKLKEFKSSDEFVARLSGDEFGLAGTYVSAQAAQNRAEELLADLRFTTSIAGFESQVSSSVGVALTGEEIADAVELARCASLAIYLSKEPGELGGFIVFDPIKHESMLTTWHEEIAVRNALRSGEFVVHFQPIVSIETRKPVGVEALIRWERPGVGLVPPDQFLPIVNRAGLTVELGSEVFRESLATWSRTLSRAFQSSNLPVPYVSINVEAVQLEDEGFIDFVLNQAALAHVPLSSIVIEVTENALAGSEVALSQLIKLREHGVRVALDDFGTGYSNFGQAQKLPLDILKIDKSFLDDIESDPRSRQMVSDVTRMAKGQGLNVTVEGVETSATVDVLGTMAVDYIQGFHFSKALSEVDLERWLSKF